MSAGGHARGARQNRDRACPALGATGIALLSAQPRERMSSAIGSGSRPSVAVKTKRPVLNTGRFVMLNLVSRSAHAVRLETAQHVPGGGRHLRIGLMLPEAAEQVHD